MLLGEGLTRGAGDAWDKKGREEGAIFGVEGVVGRG